nr:capsid protein [Eptesicus fuscus gammaherpesvirus]
MSAAAEHYLVFPVVQGRLDNDFPGHPLVQHLNNMQQGVLNDEQFVLAKQSFLTFLIAQAAYDGYLDRNAGIRRNVHDYSSLPGGSGGSGIPPPPPPPPPPPFPQPADPNSQDPNASSLNSNPADPNQSDPNNLPDPNQNNNGRPQRNHKK